MKKLNSIILFAVLFLNVQSSFSQIPIATTSINIVELGNNEVELNFYGSNVGFIHGIIYMLKLDSNYLKFQNLTYVTSDIDFGYIYRFNKSKQVFEFLYVSDELGTIINDGLIFKVKCKRQMCGGKVNWLLGQKTAYLDVIGDTIIAKFVNTKDSLGNCINSTTLTKYNLDYFTTKIFPNPVENKNLHIEYNSIEKGDLTILIIDNLGRIIYSESLINSDLSGEVSLDVSNIPLGLYYCEALLSTKNGQYKTVKKISIL